MPLIQTDSQHYSDIADAIRDMSGNEAMFYPSEMAAGVRNIPQIIGIAPIIYSLEEREVGVWTDGKPLYQKTKIYTSGLTPSTSEQLLDNNIASNIDELFFVNSGSYVLLNTGRRFTNLAYYDGSNYQCNISVVGKNSYYVIKFGSDTISRIVLTYFYTKTTDTPGSGTWTPSGVPAHHYSTTEQVIGTWIDGKTVYEKTIIGTSIEGGTTVNIAHGIQNVGEFIDCSIFVHVWDNGFWRQLNFAYNNGSTNNNWLGGFALDNTYIYFQLGTLFATTLDKWRAIIRYTKTTD